MTKKTLILAGSALLGLIAIVGTIYSYLHSPGYYLSRELHRQRNKQEALLDLSKADTKINYYRTKRNAVQYEGIDYMKSNVNPMEAMGD